MAEGHRADGFNQVIQKMKRIAAGSRRFARYGTESSPQPACCNWALIGAEPRSDPKIRLCR
jgi:hypothetical protein